MIVIVRWLWPLSLPFGSTGAIALLLLLVSQYHFWSRLSSGSRFAPEFPRVIVILFNWGFGTIAVLAALQILLDLGTLTVMLARQHLIVVPNSLRYAISGMAALTAAFGVASALRVPPVKDIEVAIRNLPPAFEGYRFASTDGSTHQPPVHGTLGKGSG